MKKSISTSNYRPTQDDLDNHSNQLNPNNDAYWNSRALTTDLTTGILIPDLENEKGRLSNSGGPLSRPRVYSIAQPPRILFVSQSPNISNCNRIFSRPFHPPYEAKMEYVL